tara:strand:- start:8405 stop:8848 length:444 start_codon:yes stop_codon:yes gene_type:complete
MKVICVTGTPGTGKTTLAKKLAKQLGFQYVDVQKLIDTNKIFEGYDKERDSKIVDTDKLNDFLIKEVIEKSKKKGLVIDSHLSHYLPKKYIDEVIVCKCDLLKLKKRLVEKGYDSKKVTENMDSEIFDVCYNEARENKHKIVTYSSD